MPIGRDQPREIRVLVIDDNGDFADLTAEMLKTDHPEFQVEIATDPTVVLECLDEGIDCLVSDYEMPEMDGIELLQAVREEHPDLPFILFTGKGSETIASEAISAGVTDYLQKSSCPDQYDILAQRITNAVEKQRAQQRVQQSLEAIETATAGISLLGGNGEFIYVNDAYATIFGYNREELLGEHWEILYRDEDVPEIRESILPAARDGIWRGESTHLDKDGNTVVTDHTLTYADDNTLVCTVDDITEKKRITNELRLKERAMDAAPIGVTIADATRDDEPIMYANDGFVELTGNSKEQILGENCRFLQGEGTSEEAVSRIREAIDNNEPVSVELRNYRQDGEEFWNRLSIAPIRDRDGTVTHYVGFQEDVTERKQTEQKATALLNQFEEFGSVLSHDLQKPLAKARSRIQLARKTNDLEQLDRADSNLGRLNTLINDFAEVMREGQIAGEMREIDLDSISKSVWNATAPASMTLEVVDAPQITADQQALRRLLENLFRNASDHAETDAQVRVGALSDGFYIADDGPGIPEHRREDIFSPGYTTDDEGTGMGLTSVWQIVLAHGWDITVTESQWDGARFEITTQPDSKQSASSPDQLSSSVT